ncbi:MAG: 50S ribosomal protein L23 [Planctomycetales bacterium]|nr:50S ribosomal protein L23 [Planctomycetales bacterium]
MNTTSTDTPATGRQKKGLQLDPHQVLMRPLVTEKGMRAANEANQYSFEVNKLASKEDVKRAVEELFDVKVLKVRTQTRKGKPRRYRFRYGRTKGWKKALVTLDSESRIDFF